MSKIRNLFKKFKKKKSVEDSTGDIDITEFVEDSELDELDELDESDQDITVFSDDEDEDLDQEIEEYEDEIEEDSAPAITATEDKTGDIPVEALEEDEDEEDEDESEDIIDEHFEEEEEEVPEYAMAQEDETGDIDVSGYVVEGTGSGTIDLDNGKIPLKDRMKDALENAKASIQNIRFRKPKKMSLKKPGEEEQAETQSKINLPPVLQGYQAKLKDQLNKVNWQNIHNDFFQSKHRQKIHRGFQILAIALLIYSAGKTTGLIIKGKKDYKDLKKNAFVDIDKSNELTSTKINKYKSAKLFKTQAPQIDSSKDKKKPVIKTNVACTKASKKSSLPIKLVNTIVLQDSVKSIASVQVRSSNELVEFRQGEKINNMAQLDRIERLRLIVKNLQDGSCESIESEQAQSRIKNPINVLNPTASKNYKKSQKKIKGINNEGNSYTIDKSLIAQKMENINDILTQARGIQITNPDGTLSFKIVDIQPGGIFSYLGIENGDIITQINGQPINDLNMVMGLFGKITNMDKLNLTIKRGGNETPLDYKFR